MNDLRRTDFYLTKEEQNNWDTHNILYNTIWFYINKKNMPDIEYSKDAITIYKKQDFFKDWGDTDHSRGGTIKNSNTQ